jgi:hypothetical protein
MLHSDQLIPLWKAYRQIREKLYRPGGGEVVFDFAKSRLKFFAILPISTLGVNRALACGLRGIRYVD